MFTAISVVMGLFVLTLFYLMLGQTERALASAQKRLIAESEAREAQIRQALNIQRVLDVMLHLSLPSLWQMSLWQGSRQPRNRLFQSP
jgi:hypothetical protein